MPHHSHSLILPATLASGSFSEHHLAGESEDISASHGGNSACTKGCVWSLRNLFFFFLQVIYNFFFLVKTFKRDKEKVKGANSSMLISKYIPATLH